MRTDTNPTTYQKHTTPPDDALSAAVAMIALLDDRRTWTDDRGTPPAIHTIAAVDIAWRTGTVSGSPSLMMQADTIEVHACPIAAWYWDKEPYAPTDPPHPGATWCTICGHIADDHPENLLF